MNSIYKKIEDPFEIFQRQFVSGDSSIYIDSAAVIAQSQGLNDFQNIDQMIYLHHFGKYLPRRGYVDDDIQEDLKVEEPLIEDVEAGEEPKKKKKRRLFGKKNRDQDNEDGVEDDPEDQ